MSNLEEVYGPCSPADYQPRSTLRFLREGREQYGELLHIRAPGPAVTGGRVHGTLYVVDCGEGWPVHVKPSETLEQKEKGRSSIR